MTDPDPDPPIAKPERPMWDKANLPSLDKMAADAKVANARMLRGSLEITLAALDNVERIGIAQDHHGLRTGRLIDYAMDKLGIARTPAYRMLELWDSGKLGDARLWAKSEYDRRSPKGKMGTAPSWRACAARYVKPAVKEKAEKSTLNEPARDPEPDTGVVDAAVDLIADDLASVQAERDAAREQIADLERRLAHSVTAEVDSILDRVVEPSPEPVTESPEVARLQRQAFELSLIVASMQGERDAALAENRWLKSELARLREPVAQPAYPTEPLIPPRPITEGLPPVVKRRGKSPPSDVPEYVAPRKKK